MPNRRDMDLLRTGITLFQKTGVDVRTAGVNSKNRLLARAAPNRQPDGDVLIGPALPTQQPALGGVHSRADR